MSSSGPELVIGVDFGTTFSGVSWAQTTGQRHVNVIKDWECPEGRLTEREKVPSVISYDESGQVLNWGFMVTPRDALPFHWMKIMLDPKHKFFDAIARDRNKISAILTRLNKTPETVVGDYLKCLWDFTVAHLKRKKGPEFQQMYNIHVVLTVPAVWTESAKDKTRRAAIAAGMPVNLELVTEPEAAALAVLKEKMEEKELRVGEAFVVCDAGGGTVDLISYIIESLEPFRVRECAVGDGELCGSIYLDLEFQKHIGRLVGEDRYRALNVEARRKMLDQFDYGIKRRFSMNPRRGQLWSVELEGVPNSHVNNITGGTIILSPSTLAGIFNTVCAKTQTLVQRQLNQMRNEGINAKAILLVGGFGDGLYLYDYLFQKNSPHVQILQAPRGISAVCRGATLCGLDRHQMQRSASVSSNRPFLPQPSMIRSRISRCSYGVCVQQPFDPTQHLEEDRIRDPWLGRDMADNQMLWLLKRGQPVTENTVVKASFYHPVKASTWLDMSSHRFVSELMYSEDDIPPTRKTPGRVKTLCRLAYKIPSGRLAWHEPSYKSVNGKEKFRKINCRVDMLLWKTSLEFKLIWRDKELGAIEAHYIEPDEDLTRWGARVPPTVTRDRGGCGGG